MRAIVMTLLGREVIILELVEESQHPHHPFILSGFQDGGVLVLGI